MSLDHPIIAIIGSGAVGSFYGAKLARQGYNVHFLLRTDYEAVRRTGLRIESRDGDFALAPEQLHFYKAPAAMPEADLAIIALKTTANDQYRPLISPLLKPDTTILTLQNGLGNEEQLAELFGQERIVGGLAFVCLNRIAPGVIRHSEYGFIRIGEFTGPPSPRLARIAELFNSSAVKCDMLPDLRFGRWEKLVWNIPFNGLGAAMGLSTDRFMASADGRELIRSLMEEVVAAARAVGVNLPPQIVQQNLDRTATMGPYKSSMQLDQEAGRPLETEAIVGNPLRAAQRAGVELPRLRMLFRMLTVR